MHGELWEGGEEEARKGEEEMGGKRKRGYILQEGKGRSYSKKHVCVNEYKALRSCSIWRS